MSAEDVVEFYGSPPGFIDLGDAPPHGRGASRFGNVIPAGVEDFPTHPSTVGELAVYESGEFYEFPPEIEALIEPRTDLLEEIFYASGSFNSILARLNRIEDGTFVTEKTSYYRSFVTNYCPDFDLYQPRTFRELTEYRLFDDRGRLRQLGKSQLSDHLGISSAVVTTSGAILLPERSEQVAVDQGTIGVSVGGSVAAEHGVKVADIGGSLIGELEEELGIDTEHVVESRYLGTVRRMERLGKPDVCAIVLVDDDDLRTEHFQDVTWENRNVTPVQLKAADRLEEIDRFLDEEMATNLLEAIGEEVARRDADASVGLCVFAGLFAAHAGFDVGGIPSTSIRAMV